MNKIIEFKYPYLSNFFKTAAERNRLFHSLILYGGNNYIQYAIALELARLLNCQKDGADDCDCQNCRWIRENKHPAVITISKIDNKTDSSKTVISEEQINNVLDILFGSSDYHRVFIFCDAKIGGLSEGELEAYKEFKSTGFNPPQGNDEEIWFPSGINKDCLSSVAANAMLKSIEEPENDVTFIFLTNNKDDLIQTIVSRSQAFYVPDVKITDYNTQFLSEYFKDYPLFKKNTALDFALYLFNYQTQNNLNGIYILNSIQYYLTEILKLNYNNKLLRTIIRDDIEKLNDSKKMLKSYIKEQMVYEDLAFYFEKRISG